MTEIEEILDKYSIPEPNSGCWIWIKSVRTANRGFQYPYINFEGRQQHVTHLALRTRGIKIINNTGACHKCDMTVCVNPNHLFVGTQKENMQDAKRKGRLVGYGVREFCKAGHPLSGDNVYINPATHKRSCRICGRRWGRLHDAKRRPPKRIRDGEQPVD